MIYMQFTSLEEERDYLIERLKQVDLYLKAPEHQRHQVPRKTSTEKNVRTDTARGGVLAALKSGPKTSHEICKATGSHPKNQIYAAIHQMYARGEIEAVEDGSCWKRTYSLPPALPDVVLGKERKKPVAK